MTTPLEKYLHDLQEIRSSGASVKETSYYPALRNVLCEIGHKLKPKVICVMNLAEQGAGLPDGGLFSEEQFDKKAKEPKQGQMPSRGAIEVKGAKDDAWVTAEGEQVARYWKRYRQVLVTNYREFVLVGQDSEGRPVRLERYSLAGSAPAFWDLARHPRTAAKNQSERFTDFLKRVMLHAAPLATPEDLAWFLASYAREALARIEGQPGASMQTVRTALEEALGLKFEGEKGEHFFRSSLVQTLFYGVFSAWVLWDKQHPRTDKKARFAWRDTADLLRVPIIRTLFYQAADPGRIEAMALTEVLEWAAAVLNRVDRTAFFAKFEEGHAVQYFYEPFLEEFDPELRKQLGVWYTPPEIVEYMVARVDTVLREELGVMDGLADKQVYVLDPCCGTGSYLVEVLKRIHATLEKKGKDALTAGDLKEAAQKRVFGFEILPAPFVVAHLQLGLLLQHLGAPLGSKKEDRVGVYLTNALTGWEPPKEPKTKFLFPELKEEHDAAEKVKRDTPILVILGNPPYNGFAGVGVDEERDLTTAYRSTKRAPAPQGQGLNDLYVRFYRMAERRIVEQTGRGVVCFISNYSWLDGLSFTGMREQYVEKFARVWVDCLNGDKYKTGKVTPEGEPDPSVFSTEWNREGIQVGTAIGLLVKRKGKQGVEEVRFRHLWGNRKRQLLVETAQQDGVRLYEKLKPAVEIGLPFMPVQFKSEYFNWPLLTELFPTSFPGVKTSRDDFVVDVGRERLEARLKEYFDAKTPHEEIRKKYPGVMERTARFDPVSVREHLLKRGFLPEKVVRYCYRPFDVRWLYWEPKTKLLDEKREEYFPHVQEGNIWIEARQKQPMENFDRGYFLRVMGDNFGNGLSSFFPLHLSVEAKPRLLREGDEPSFSGNLSPQSFAYLKRMKHDETELFYHAVSILNCTSYRAENGGALRQDWPRVPLPASTELLERSAELGRHVAGLLDTEAPVKGVTEGEIRGELKLIGVATRSQRGGSKDAPLQNEDLAVTAGWGHAGKGGVTMPGRGKLVEREYRAAERKAIAEGAKTLGLSEKEALAHLGEKTCDIYLNDVAYWANVPQRVWEYTIGGYQVMKKWLSYREEKLLGRALKSEEVRYVQEMARRIAAILLLEPALDANYQAVKENTFPWDSLKS